MDESTMPRRATKVDGALDYLLETFLGDQHNEHAEGEPGAVGITVYVRGTAFTGIAISRREWLERFTARTESVAPEGAELLRATLAELWAEQDDRDREIAAADEPLEPRYFIHMKDVTAYTGLAPQKNQLMRIDATSIDAWTIGMLKPAD